MVMEKKWIKDLGSNECIHTPTQEISDKLRKKLDELGLKWCDGQSYVKWSFYHFHKEQTFIFPYHGTFANKDYVNGVSAKIYTISDLLDFEGEQHSITDEGYTKEEIELLDRFAGLAMNGLVSKYGNEGTYSTLSQMSYDVAKEMLSARKEALKNG